MIDVAMCLDRLVPGASYRGSLTFDYVERAHESDPARAYRALRWMDERPAPSWEDIEAVWPDVAAELGEPPPRGFTSAAAARSWKRSQIARDQKRRLAESDGRLADAWEHLHFRADDSRVRALHDYREALRNLPGQAQADLDSLDNVGEIVGYEPSWPAFPDR